MAGHPLTSVTVPTHDGGLLHGDLHLPDDPPATVVVLGHAMMADRRSLDRPAGAGLLAALCAAGLGVLRVDLRGHGESRLAGRRRPDGGGRAWAYDDLVADAGSLAAWVAERFPAATRVAVGHSLFGHTALAFQATRDAAAGYDRLVLIAGNVWLPQLEPLRSRRLAKDVAARGWRLLMPRHGLLPVRRLGLGSSDVSADFLRQVMGWQVRGDWTARDGRSYLDALPGVKEPVLSIAGAADRLLSTPSSQERFAALTGGPVLFETVGRATGFPVDAGHMALVLDRRFASMWARVARFATDGT
ncbi:serine aminopeptidase domain-containing protein [Spongisporangium articulatum]|uniref:Serine aminopeptidase domain-containing protein n=1 Tax=Spongisporangium articulatum TaxID=3362603 RepID=A0ABW8AL52_9ACTN